RARSTEEALTEPPGPAEVFGRGQPFIRVAPGAEPSRAIPPPARAEPPPPARAEPPRAPARAEPPRPPPQAAVEPPRPPPQAAVEPPRPPPQAAVEPPAPPSSIPLTEDLEIRMIGAN